MGNGAPVVGNDDWRQSPSDIQGTGLAPTDDRESALLLTLGPGSYTAILHGKGTASGVALAEVYDLTSTANARVGNLSTRGVVGTLNNVMIGGFIIGRGLGTNGNGSAKVVVRGLGPSLSQFGITDALQDPFLELHDGNGAEMATNDNWRTSQQAEIQASGLAPTDNREAAIIAVLTQGNYTAVLRGAGNTTGVGLIEVYNIP